MSRIIVKNLPKSITAKKLENLFASKGVITDLQLKYNKSGIFRQFAFVGYKTEEEASAAREYFNNTFINTARIKVDICTGLGDSSKPKPWKKQEIVPDVPKEMKQEEIEEKAKSKKEKKKKDEIPENLLKDAKFKEFLEVNKDRKNKPVWAEDVDVPEGLDAEASDGSSSSDSDYEQNYNKSLKPDKVDNGKKLADIPKKMSQNLKDDCITSDQSNNKESPKKETSFDDSFTVKVRNLPFSCKKKDIKQFFHALKISSLRLPPKIKGFAYVKFKTEKDMKQALNKNKGFLAGHRVDVVKYTKKEDELPKHKNSAQVENDKEQNEELLAETGRIYVRNLCYNVTETEIQELFNKYGPIAEIHIPIDYLTKKCQGFAFVSYVFAEHAIKAFTELDGTVFQGRMLHLIPARPKKEYVVNENETNFKKKKEAKMKAQSGSSHNWNILFMDKNAVADIIAEKYCVEKSKLLSDDGKESAAVRLALAETEMVMENRNFLIQSGVQLDAFSQPAAERSKTVIVVKHLPANTTAPEMQDIFSKYGALARVILPPSGTVALIEFDNPSEAKTAFRRLAYTRFHRLPLYLEWAPVDAVKPPTDLSTDKTEESPTDSVKEDKSEKPEETSEVQQLNEDEPPPGTTVFVRNINFNSTQEAFRKHFKKCGPVHYATISTKTDVKTGKLLSLGFGFVQFKNKESAVQAIQNLQQSLLDGHSLELKFANRETKPLTFTKRKKYEVKKQLSAKILVRNIPFEASEKDIRELFMQFGTLKIVRLPIKLDGSGEHRGFGFVEYYAKDNAERAFNALCHSTHFFGRRLVLEWANPDTEDVEVLRKKTARDFVDEEPRKKFKKKKFSDDISLAAGRYGETEDAAE